MSLRKKILLAGELGTIDSGEPELLLSVPAPTPYVDDGL